MKEFLRRHPLAITAVMGAAVVFFLVWADFVLGRPLPPRTVVMTTGPEGGAYRELGERYRAALAREGIELKLVPSLGDVENLQRLKDAASGVSAGLVAGGLTSAGESPGVVSLGTISYDPIWIFCRGLPAPVGLRYLRGKRVSIGPEGSGTRFAVTALLRVNDLVDTITPSQFTPAGGAEALLAGEIDCACMLSSWDAPVVRKLLGDERVSLLTIPRADAYVALSPHLKKLTVPRGVGNLAKDLPREDTTLLAAMSSLLVREDLHPAIQFLLLEAAAAIHSRPGIVRRPGQFPAPEPVDVPLAAEARTYYRSGGTFLQRHLPFWLGVLAQRILLVLIPLAGVVYPLARLQSALVPFAVEQRFRSLNKELRPIKARLAAGEPGAHRDLSALEARIVAMNVPAWGARALYTLRQHVAVVSARLDAR